MGEKGAASNRSKEGGQHSRERLGEKKGAEKEDRPHSGEKEGDWEKGDENKGDATRGLYPGRRGNGSLCQKGVASSAKRANSHTLLHND